MPDSVLVIAPHMDDEVLGCGGTIAKHVSQGDAVEVAFVCNRRYNHVFDQAANHVEERDAHSARAALGYHRSYFLRQEDEAAELWKVVIALEQVVQQVDPTLVYVNHMGDNHQDHQVVFQAAMVVLRQTAVRKVRRVLTYETPSSTDQAPPIYQAFQPTSYHDISHHLDRKITAISCYRREYRLPPHPRSIEAVRALAALRGAQSGCSYAEAFMVIREKWV